VCYDLHANKQCDPDEGIAGVAVYASDPQRGQVLGQTRTDGTGLAAFSWGIHPDDRATAQVTLNVPYFQQVRAVRAAEPTAKPVIITKLAPLPALLP
jgi:hypothetical protein